MLNALKHPTRKEAIEPPWHLNEALQLLSQELAEAFGPKAEPIGSPAHSDLLDVCVLTPCAQHPAYVPVHNPLPY